MPSSQILFNSRQVLPAVRVLSSQFQISRHQVGKRGQQEGVSNASRTLQVRAARTTAALRLRRMQLVAR